MQKALSAPELTPMAEAKYVRAIRLEISEPVALPLFELISPLG
jgi:hypothetical protein